MPVVTRPAARPGPARWLVPLGLLLGVAGGQVVAAAGPTSYASSTELLVTARDAVGPAAAYVGALFTDQRVVSYLQLVGTADLSDRVEAELGTAVPAGAVDAEVLAGTTVVRVTARDASSTGAAVLADAYGRAMVAAITALETPDSAAPGVAVTVVETATDPVQVAPDRVRDLAGGALLGVVAGLAGAVLVARRRRRTLGRAADVAAVAGDAPVVLVLEPAQSGGPPAPLDGGRDGVFLARAVRSGPGAVDPRPGQQVLAVTGATAADHRPELALTVAHELVALGRRVLVVDPGTSTPGDLPALRDRYDHVVLDLPCPPTDPLPDAGPASWWAVVDGCYPVTRYGVGTPAELAGVLEAVEGRGVAVLAVVLDRVPPAAAVAQGRVHPYPPDRARRGPAHRSTRPATRPVVPVESG